jgi:hypothetical protein
MLFGCGYAALCSLWQKDFSSLYQKFPRTSMRKSFPFKYQERLRKELPECIYNFSFFRYGCIIKKGSAICRKTRAMAGKGKAG